MSTRCVVTFKDSKEDGGAEWHVYRHHDGYPGTSHGVIAALACMFAEAKLCWELPRFEACEAAAAFVVTCKTRGGGIYLSKGPKAHGDLEWCYRVELKRDRATPRLYVTVLRVDEAHNGATKYTQVKKGVLASVFAEYNAEEPADA